MDFSITWKVEAAADREFSCRIPLHSGYAIMRDLRGLEDARFHKMGGNGMDDHGQERLTIATRQVLNCNSKRKRGQPHLYS